ncbi:MAG: leukotoxin LktA family filamentous adhesin [Methyloversatilis sp.]|jgi:filamentous hemagglutinin family protein|nr:leukotoxin LktA family filamentous adhesin [Methyloversatilis sp.]
MKTAQRRRSQPRLRTLVATLRNGHGLMVGVASLPLLMSSAAWAQAIQADGRTLTTVTTAGAVTDVRTATVSGNTGFNAFKHFSVNAGHTANLHVPGGALNLVNIVRDTRTDIHGTLNAIRDGRIGGNVYFANPHGFVVGAGGIVNVGALSVSTPTQGFVDRFFTAPGVVDAGALGQLLNGTAPLSSAAIRIDGRINAIDAVELAAGTVSVKGVVLTGARFEGQAPDFTDVVNAQGLAIGSRVVERAGRIYIAAADDIEIAGTLDARGGAGTDGGDITLRAGRDIVADIDAMVTAAGDGDDSDGGRIDSLAQRSAVIRSGAVMDASAGSRGDGGFVEFSAKDTVELAGGQFYADGRGGGQGGNILIDPEDILISAHLLRGASGYSGVPAGPDNGVTISGADLTLLANRKITVNENITVSSRRVSGTDAASHLNGQSIDASGDITFQAREIELKSGSKVLAHSTGTHAAGDVSLLASELPEAPVFGSFDDAVASITVNNARITGKDVVLRATADDTWEWTGNEYADVVLDFLDSLSIGANITRSVASATVTVDGGAYIGASGDLTIESLAKTDASMRVVSTLLGFGYGETDADAKVDIRTATLSADGDMKLRSVADSTLLVKVDTVNTGRFTNMLSSASKYANGSVAVGIVNQSAEALVGSGAVIDKAGSLLVEATGEKSHEVSASGGSFKDGVASAGIAVSITNTTMNASLGGEVKQSGSVTVSASLAADASTSVSAAAGTAGSPDVQESITSARDIDEILFEKMSDFVARVPETDSRSKDGGSGSTAFGLSAAFAWVENTNTVGAGIAAGGKVTSGGGVNVRAAAEEGFSVETSAAVDQVETGQQKPGDPNTPEQKKNIAVSGSIALIDMDHHVNATIGDGAVVNAGGAVAVTADAVVTPFWQQWVDAYEELAGLDWSKIDEDVDVWLTLGETLKDFVNQPISATTWVQSAVESERLSFAGAVDYFTLDNKANASVGSATINGNVDSAGAAQDVIVAAHARQGLLNLVGVPEFDPTSMGSNTDSSTAGFGGSYHHLTLTGGADARIATGANVRADELAVLAESDLDQVTVAEAAGKAGKVSINGAFSLIDSDVGTIAQIGAGTTVNARDVVLQAVDDSMSVNVAGGVARAGSVGIGFSIALNDLDRNTQALIGNRVGETATGGTLTASGNVRLEAQSGALQGAFAIAGSGPAGGNTSTEGKTGGDGAKKSAKDTGEQGKSGIGISAAVSINIIDDTTRAVLSDLTSVQVQGSAGSSMALDLDGDGSSDRNVTMSKGLEARARNDALAIAGAGGLTVGSGKSAGLGGAFTWNQLGKITQAGIANTALTLTNGGNVLLDAYNTGPMWSVAVGVATGNKVGAAGSVSYSDIDNETSTSISESGVDTDGSVTLTSLDESDIRSVAGAASYGGKAGFGAAVAISTVQSNTVAEITTTAAKPRTVRGDAGVSASASSDSDIVSVAASLSGSQGVAVSGSVTFNAITNETRASASNMTLQSDGAMSFNAVDSSRIQSLAGAVGVSTSSVGAGIAGSYNEIGNTTRAAIERSTVEDVASLTVNASNTTTFRALAAAGALASTAGIAGSAAISRTDGQNVTAEIVDSDVDAGDALVRVMASDTTTIESLAGGLGLGVSGAGVGLGVAVNTVGNTTLARVSGKRTDAGFDVASLIVSADSLATIDTAAAGIGASIGGVGIGGSTAVNLIGSNTRAKIENGAAIEARDNVAVLAEADDRISVIAGAAGVGFGTAGVGASATVNEITGTTEALIDGSSVAARAESATGVTVNNGVVADPELSDTIDAIANQDENGPPAYSSSNPFEAPDLTASRGTQQVRGIAVNALATHQTTNVVANIAGGLYAGVAATASVSIIGGETSARVTDSVLNGGDNSGASSAQAVSVRAADHSYGTTFIGSGAFGAAGVGLSADVNVFERNTIAGMQDVSRLDALGATEVSALSEQGVASVVVGASGGAVAVVGSGSVAKFTSTTEAYVRNSVLDVGSLDVDAAHRSTFFVTGGGLAVGGVGVAGTFAVALDTSTTTAEVSDSEIDASGAVDVNASSATDIGAWSLGGAGGGAAGVAGAVTLGIVDSTTAASVVDSRIGSASDRAGNLSVTATDRVTAEARAGAGAVGGIAGVGAGASILKVDNSTTATVQDSDAHVAGAITVSALAERDLDNVAAAAAAGGTVGIGGAAAVTLLNAGMTEDASGELDNTEGDNEGTLTTAQSFSGNGARFSASGDSANIKATSAFDEDDIARINASSTVAAKDRVNAGPDGATRAQVIDTASTAANTLRAGGNIQVSAQENDALSVKAGGAALGGLAGVGASVGVLEVRHDVRALTDGAITLQSDTGDIDVTASTGRLRDTDAAADVRSFQAAGGLVGVGAAVATADLRNTVEAKLGDGSTATVGTAAGDVRVQAGDTMDASAHAQGYAVGVVAAGIVIARADKAGSTTAQVGEADTTSGNAAASSLTLAGGALAIESTRGDSVSATSRAGSGGVAAGSGSEATASATGVARAGMADRVTVTAPGSSVSVAARSTPNVYARAEGYNGSLAVSIGVSLAQASAATQSYATMGRNNSITAGSLSLNAATLLPTLGETAYSYANATGGSLLVGANGSDSVATSTALVNATVGGSNSFTISGSTRLTASNQTRQTAQTSGVTIGGLLAIGANLASARADSTTLASIDNGNTGNVGSTLSVLATGHDQTYADAEAGSGGIIAGAAAVASTRNKSNTRALLGGGNATTALATGSGGSMEVRADHIATFNSRVDSLSAGVVGASGAQARNDIDARVVAGITAGANLTTWDLDVYALNQTRKPWLSEFNVFAGAGGLAGGAAGSSETRVDNVTLVEVGDGAHVRVLGDPDDAGRTSFNAVSDVMLRDRAKLEAGGAISAADAEAKVWLNAAPLSAAADDVGRTEARVGNNVTIDTVGDFNLAARDLADVEVRANSKTWGLAAYADGYSLSDLRVRSRAAVGSGSDIRADGFINVGAGRDANGVRNHFSSVARADLYNNSAVPISSTDWGADALLDQNSTIGIAGTLRSVMDVNLTADKGFGNLVDGRGVAKDLYSQAASAVASGISNLFGGGDVSIEQNSGRSIDVSRSGVTVSGLIDAGIQNKQLMTISDNPSDGAQSVTLTAQVPREGQPAKCQTPGTADCVYDTVSKQYWITRSEGIDMPTARIENLQDNLQARIDALKRIRGQYSGVTSTGADASNPETVAALSAEISFLESQMASLFPEGGASARVADAAFIILPDIKARGGNINVIGDHLAGNGSLNARGDAEISIINNSSAFLRTNELIIPEDATGRLTLNSVAILNDPGTSPTTPQINAALNARNSGGTAAFGNVDIAPDSAVPQIEVRNTYVPLTSDTRAPDIEVVGDVSNLLGSVVMESERGSVLVQPADPANPLTAPNIRANTINIKAGRDFVFSSPSAFYHTAGNPRDLWGGTRTPSGGSGGLANNFEDGGTFSGSSSDIRTGNAQSTIAGNNIFISARYLNINGLLQSGLPDRTVTIDGAARVNLGIGPYKTDTTLAQAKANYDALVEAGMKPTDPRFRISHTAGNIVAFFNAELNRIELEPVKVEGGKLELLGEILNTGGGRIAAMDGYGRFSINNLTGYDIVLNGLDTGNDIEGRVRITDYLRRWDPNANGGLGDIVTAPLQSSTATQAYYDSLTPVTREVTRLGANVQARDLIKTTDGNNELVDVEVKRYDDIANSRSTSYAPVSGQTYTWVTGQRETTDTYEKYERETKFWFFPGDWSLADRTDVKTYEDKTPLMEGEYTKIDTSMGDTTYRYQRRDVVTSFNRTIADKSKCSWFFCIWKWHTREVWTDVGKKRYNTHTVKGDLSIPISFIGYDSGQVDVRSGADIILAGSLINRTGSTTLDAREGNGLAGGAIVGESARGSITAQNLTLNAETGIGRVTTPLQIDMLGNAVVNAVSAQGDIGLREMTGSMRVNQVRTDDAGRVLLQADGDIVAAGSGNAVRVQGGGVELVSVSGRIGSDAQALVVQTQATAQGGLRATASGDIHLMQPSGDMQLDKVESQSGDVTLTALGGRIIDGNRNETRDTRAEAELDALWGDLRLRASDGAADSLADALKGHRAQITREYQEYWSLRNVELIEDPQNAGAFIYRADGYNAASASTRLRTLHDKLSGLGITLGTSGGGSYDSGFSYVGSADRDSVIAGMSDGSHIWTDNQVRYGVSAAIYNKSTSDTETRIEQPNVVGRHIVLNANSANGGVGRDEGQFTVSIASEDVARLTPEERRALAAAEADDVAIDAVAKTATVLERDDVDIATTAGGSVTVNARGHVFLGADDYDRNGTVLPGDINLVSLDATGGGVDYDKTIRLKVSGGIVDASTTNAANLRGGSTIIEAGSGSIGSAAKPIRLDLGAAAALTARAATGIWLSQMSGPMRVAEMFVDSGGIHLSSGGSILDGGGPQRPGTVRALTGNVDLLSGGSVTVREAIADEGSTTVIAEDDILMDAVTAGNGVTLESKNGSVSVTRITGDILSLSAKELNLGTLNIGRSLNFSSESVTARIVHTRNDAPLAMRATGRGGVQPARWLDLTFNSAVGVRFDRFSALDAEVTTERGFLRIDQGRIENRARFINPVSNVYMDNLTTVVEPADVQLHHPGKVFGNMLLDEWLLVTDPYVVMRDPLHEVVMNTVLDYSGREQSRELIVTRVNTPDKQSALGQVPQIASVSINVPLDFPAVNSGEEESEEEAEARRRAEEEVIE